MQRMLLLFGLLLATPCFTAPPSHELADWNRQRVATSEHAMQTLGGWALLNLAGSGIGLATSTGQAFSFYQMNVYWNVVNLAIAGGAYWSLRGKNPEAMTWRESLEDYRNTERILWLNIGLDAAYVLAGFYLRELGNRRRLEGNGPASDKFFGYGNSVLLQGAFLLLFDSTFAWAIANQWPAIAEHLAITPAGATVSWRW